MNNVLRELLKISVLVFVLVAVQSFAFSEPTSVPPVGNVAAPINTSGVQQTKAGNLILNSGLSVNASTWLAVLGGSVGIGTASPLEKLHVLGGKAQADDFCLNSPTTLCLSSVKSGISGYQVFTSSGSWTAPAGITQVLVEAWGGGGAGGGGTGGVGLNCNKGGRGGGAGGYGKSVVAVIPGNTYTVTVAIGGAIANGPGGSGGTSGFGSLISAFGGQGGGCGGQNPPSIPGGVGGSASATEVINGGTGGPAWYINPDATGGEGGVAHLSQGVGNLWVGSYAGNVVGNGGSGWGSGSGGFGISAQPGQNGKVRLLW